MTNSELEKKVADIIEEKLENKDMFTSYDITMKLREQEKEYVDSHSAVRDAVNSLYHNDVFSGYCISRSLMSLEKDGEGFQAFVYYMDGTTDPYYYPLAKKEIVGIDDITDTV